MRNIALMAHVDAGKTTLTERLLFCAGVTRALGSVDAGTARTDDLAVERQRGISVRSAFISFDVGGTTINLIDTPGHADFYSQVERAFLAVDAIVVLVSAVDGVQSGTETIVTEALAQGLPLMFFLNKCDRDTARPAEVLEQLRGLVGGAFAYPEAAHETAALFDDGLMEDYLEGRTSDPAKITSILREQIKAGQATPVLCGSAATGQGVDALLAAVCYLLPAAPVDDAPSAGVIFSVAHDKTLGRGAFVRMYEGSLHTRDAVNIGPATHKAAIIKQQTNGKWANVESLASGQIGLVYGLADCRTGQVIGAPARLPPRAARGLVRQPLLTAQITPAIPAELPALKAAMEEMAAEDPTLGLAWEPISGKLNIDVMGAIHVETLAAVIRERFGLAVAIDPPEVIYKETPAQPGEGFDAYTMPKPCWAVLRFALAPAPRGSGIAYTCSAAANRLSYRYRGQVEQSIAPSLRQGLYGWEVTDLSIDLVDGQDHHIHTHPLDFTIATPLALMDGLVHCGTTLLEPILQVRLTFDQKHAGRVTSDIIRMRGEPRQATYRGPNMTLEALLPLATSLDYPAAFASLTSGTGIMTQKLHTYRECPLELGKIRDRRGVDPRDRAKYILAARHAMSGTVFE